MLSVNSLLQRIGARYAFLANSMQLASGDTTAATMKAKIAGPKGASHLPAPLKRPASRRVMASASRFICRMPKGWSYATQKPLQMGIARHYATITIPSPVVETAPDLTDTLDEALEVLAETLDEEQDRMSAINLTWRCGEIIKVAHEVLGFVKFDKESCRYLAIPPEPSQQISASGHSAHPAENEDRILQKPISKIMSPLLDGTPVSTFTILDNPFSCLLIAQYFDMTVPLALQYLVMHHRAHRRNASERTRVDNHLVYMLSEKDLVKLARLFTWLLKEKSIDDVAKSFKDLSHTKTLRDIVMSLWEKSTAWVKYRAQLELLQTESFAHGIDGMSLLWREIVGVRALSLRERGDMGSTSLKTDKDEDAETQELWKQVSEKWVPPGLTSEQTWKFWELWLVDLGDLFELTDEQKENMPTVMMGGVKDDEFVKLIDGMLEEWCQFKWKTMSLRRIRSSKRTAE